MPNEHTAPRHGSGPTLHQRLVRDPRHYQIAVLGGLIAYGATALDFEIRPAVALVVIVTAQLGQWLATQCYRLPRFDPRSAAISSLSLVLLLRTDSLLLAALAAAIAIASKFLLRWRGKHIWNPTNLALVAMLLTTDRVWVSPGQWGSAALAAFVLAGLGALVTYRAARSDVTWGFLATWITIVFGRAWWLGDPWTIPRHQLESGALLVFAFFMISDPKTTPDSRPARLAYAALVASLGAVLHFRFHEPNGLLWALASCAPLVPVLDRLSPGGHYRWSSPRHPNRRTPMSRSLRPRTAIATLVLGFALLASLAATRADAFCGFYVGKAGTNLFNRASKVVLVRDGDRTVLTMANDVHGDPRDFAMVIPVPTSIGRDQIHVAEPAVIDHLDAFTAPRLVEYHDPDPCARHELRRLAQADLLEQAMPAAAKADRQRSLGVTVEARYAVGEYDILILSAEESRGLLTWLRTNGYRLPDGAEPVLGSYIKQKMRFFVARVDLDEHARLGNRYLRPLQVAYESPRFMLPIRLGMLNADGPQELFVFALTRTGRIETTNYRTVRLPSDIELPTFVRDRFADVYRDLFTAQVAAERRAVFLEYAWDMAWCDPCAADPLRPDELRQLGVFWVDEQTDRWPPSGVVARPQDVFVTRLHLRYDGTTFPDDLRFQETGDRSTFQGRYVLRHPWTGPARCPAADAYFTELGRRQEREAQNLAHLTGWPLADIRAQLPRPITTTAPTEDDTPWWKKIWGR